MIQEVKQSSLYLLVFPNRGLLKVGKANDVHSRYCTLKRWWGEADLSESYELIGTTETVFKLEKALHVLLSSYLARADVGDGRTEMFELASLESAIKLIEIFVSTGASSIGLVKGISAPGVSPSASKRDLIGDRVAEAGRLAAKFGGAHGVALTVNVSGRPQTSKIGSIAEGLLRTLTQLSRRGDSTVISRSELSRMLKCSESSVKRAIAALKVNGLLLVEQIGGKGGLNSYTLNSAAIANTHLAQIQ